MKRILKSTVAAALAAAVMFGGVLSELPVLKGYDTAVFASAAADPSAGASATLKNLKVSSMTGTTATICWSKITSPAMKNYNIYKGTGGKAICKVDASKNSYTFTGLEPNTAYTYSVKAWNGSSVYSTLETVSFTTPLAALTNLHLVTATETSVTLGWNQVNGATSFNLYNGTGGKKIQSVAGTENTITITGLKKGTSYTFSVRGWNGSKRYTELKTITVSTMSGGISLDVNILDQLSAEFPAKKGCGGTSLTMLLQSEKGLNVTKKDVLTTQYSNGLYLITTGSNNFELTTSYAKKYSVLELCNKYGSTLSELVCVAMKYGINANLNRQPTAADIDKLLAQGHLVLIGQRMKSINTLDGYKIVSTREYEGTDHFVVCRGKTAEGNYIIVNPYQGYEDVWTPEQTIENIYNAETGWAVSGLLWLS